MCHGNNRSFVLRSADLSYLQLITVGCSGFSLASRVQLPQYILKGASCYFPLLYSGLCNRHRANWCSDILWEIVRQSWNHHHVMTMLTVLIPGSMIIQRNLRYLGNLLVYKQGGPEMFTSFVARITLAYYHLSLVCFSVVAEVWDHALMGYMGLGHKSMLLFGCFFLWCKHSSLWRSLPNPSDCHLN